MKNHIEGTKADFEGGKNSRAASMDTGVRVGLSLEWRPAWLMSLAKSTGAVFLHCTHCNSGSPVEADFCSFLVSEEKTKYRPKCIVYNTYSSPQHSTQPDDYGS